MAGNGPAAEFDEQLLRIQEALRSTASTSGRPEEVLPDALLDVLPTMMQNIKNGEAPEKQDPRSKALLFNAMRAVAAQATRSAHAADVSPLQYQPEGAPGPLLPPLLELALFMAENRYTDTVLTMQLLEDVMEGTTLGHCAHVLGWLEAHSARLKAPMTQQNPQAAQQARLPLLRACNRLQWRLSKSADTGLCASILLLMAKVFPLSERSGNNVTGTVNTGHSTTVDEVPPGAVDSNGEPVDQRLYTTFWGLQDALQNPKNATSSNDNWSKLYSSVKLVLSEFDKRPTTVPASMRGSSRAPSSSAAGEQQNGHGGDAGAAGAAGHAMVQYLSSHKLFGLQLRDATFRRNFLVQVLILLDALRNPIKLEPLKAKQLEQAQELEALVYHALEATPEDGKRFAAAVRASLARESNWADWKRGPEWAAKPEGAKAQANTCPDWKRPPPPSLQEAVDRAAKAERARKLEGRNGPGRPAKRQKTSSQADALLNSRVGEWCSSIPEDNLAGLTVDHVKIPRLEEFAQEMIDQMDPEADIEDEFKLKKDPVFRWKLARLVSRRVVELATVDVADIDKSISIMLPEQLPESLKSKGQAAQQGGEDAAASEAEAAKAEAAADAAMEQEVVGDAE